MGTLHCRPTVGVCTVGVLVAAAVERRALVDILAEHPVAEEAGAARAVAPALAQQSWDQTSDHRFIAIENTAE